MNQAPPPGPNLQDLRPVLAGRAQSFRALSRHCYLPCARVMATHVTPCQVPAGGRVCTECTRRHTGCRLVPPTAIHRLNSLMDRVDTERATRGFGVQFEVPQLLGPGSLAVQNVLNGLQTQFNNAVTARALPRSRTPPSIGGNAHRNCSFGHITCKRIYLQQANYYGGASTSYNLQHIHTFQLPLLIP